MLITGSSGMLGGTLVKYFSEKFDVYATSGQQDLCFAKNHLKFDLNWDNYDQLLGWAKPDVIIHCAALTNGNLCANNPELAIQTNGLTLNKLAQAVDSSTKIIYISSDAVFPARVHKATELDNTGSESVYGKSKELGEFFLALNSENFTIIRTTIVGFNHLPSRQSFVEWIVNSSIHEKHINLFDDVVFTPISCLSLAHAISTIIDEELFMNSIVHVAGSDVCSKLEFGVHLLNSLGLSTEYIDRGQIANFDGRANRSGDQSLDCSYFEQVSGCKLPGLIETVTQLTNEFYDAKRSPTGL